MLLVGSLAAVAVLLRTAPVAAQTAKWAKASGETQIESRTVETAQSTTIRADVGLLAVPENRAAANSRLIEIRFARLRSTAARPGAPLFYLTGGPGSTATGAIEDPRQLGLWVPLLAIGDVVLIDQRGTRDPDLRWQWDGPPPTHFFADPDTALAHSLAMCRRAVPAIRARGVDLAGYTTTESAEDLEALRVALGAPQVSLLGFSYGTHLAFAYLRRHDTRVANAVLVGCEGPNMTFKLPSSADTQWAKIATLAAADPRVAPTIPDLTALLDQVDAQLERQPMLVDLQVPGSNETVKVPIGPFGLHMILRIDIGDASDIPVFPRLLWSIAHNDAGPMTWFVRKRAGLTLGVHGMSYMMDAASGATPERLSTIAAEARTSRWGDVVNFPFPEVGAVFAPPDLGPDFRRPIVTKARTLFLSGTLDWNTPPYQAEELRWGFPNSTHIVVENAGHEQVLLANDAAVPLVVDFLAGQDVRNRRIDLPPLRFVPLEGKDPQATHPSVE
jgi:pimeloyl-ACP methyl ester carboxylesterase